MKNFKTALLVTASALLVSTFVVIFMGTTACGQQVGIGQSVMIQAHGHSNAADGGAIELPMISLYKSSSTVITSGSYTYVRFDVETKDPNNYYNPSTGAFTPLVAGWYFVSWNQQAYCSTGLTSVTLAIDKNGIAVGKIINTEALAGNQGYSLSSLVYMNGSTDYIYANYTVSGTGTCYVLGSIEQSNFAAMYLSK